MKQHTILQIQCSWEDFISDKSIKKFWLTCNPDYSKNVYCDVSVGSNDTFKCELGDFEVTNFDRAKKTITITYKPTQTSRTFVAPHSVYSQLHNKGAINCIDLSPGGNIGISGGTHGRLRVWDANTGQLRRDLKGHVSDIDVCRILPSGKVAMSGGSDFQIRIWDLSSGECAVTLKGHTSGVTGIDFIDRGRNFVSSSRDGTVRLWDCASQSVITQLYNSPGSEVNQLCVAHNNTLGSSGQALDEKEFSTEGHITGLVTSHGSLSVIDVRSRKPIYSYTTSTELKSCQFLDHGNVFVAGSEDGRLLKADLRMNATPEETRVSTVSIKSMKQYERDSVWCSTADGSCLLWNATNNEILYDLSGSDYDPLNGIAVFNKTVITCCKDGAVRRYDL
jgi:proteasomal ATPase-associated factor 1